VQEQLVLPES